MTKSLVDNARRRQHAAGRYVACFQSLLDIFELSIIVPADVISVTGDSVGVTNLISSAIPLPKRGEVFSHIIVITSRTLGPRKAGPMDWPGLGVLAPLSVLALRKLPIGVARAKKLAVSNSISPYNI